METGGEVKALAFSPDGRTLAAVTGDGDVTVWDVAIRSLRYPPIRAAVPAFIAGVAFSPDGTMLVATAARRRDALGRRHRRERWAVRRIGPPATLAFSADGTLAAFARLQRRRGLGRGRALASRPSRVTRGGRVLRRAQPRRPDLAVGGFGRFVRLWDVGTGSSSTSSTWAAGQIRSSSARTAPSSPSPARAGRSLWDVATGTRIGPNLTAGRRDGDDRSVARRAPAAGDDARRPRARSGTSTRIVGPSGHARSPTAR